MLMKTNILQEKRPFIEFSFIQIYKGHFINLEDQKRKRFAGNYQLISFLILLYWELTF